MSAGSRIVPVRIPEDLELAILDCIAGRNLRSPNEPWTMSEFIRQAITEKLCHMERSRSRRRIRAKEAPYEG